jgi:arginyl-tRNA synthetase
VLSSLASNPKAREDLLEDLSVRQLLGDWAYFETFSERALKEKDPSQIATALLNISKSFNQLYHKIRFLDQKSKEALKLLMDLAQGTQKILRHGLWILGIEAPEEM